ncbi:short-chain fatty acyl-CoA regulator family protein [Actinomadura sp. WMMB 499]|uniref:short-chain fatty acyl-CoA regulator family protein n=1 Tax=Actinomadura sp. WMMB 499 TaxID=1219491 RepID=UPI001244E510|nr:short-chain fatty acyl-CoA regulator family protein [Actinomadura sp. WMMB 499]QFG26232.1 ImmA/IrrE family metallo-endopeptidase [Actinomadura sp. WMMB 499]
MGKIFVGPRLRHLRADRRISQVGLAEMLEISPSYLNQIEHNQRPLTAPVLLRLTELFGLDPEFFSPEDGTRLIADLREALPGAPPAEIADLAASFPGTAHAVVDLHRRQQRAAEHASVLAGAHQSAPAPYELVRDFFYDRHNYIHELDRAAETVSDGHDPATAALDRLGSHGVRVTTSDGARRHYDPGTRTLSVSPDLTGAQRTFQLATQIALLEHGDLLTELVGTAPFADEQARALTRIGLANYFAGAFLLPYRTFRDAAEEARYDLDALTARFAVGFETVCHRLSSLQRPRLRGVPFSFVRVDRAGNISKRQSATGFHFSRAGGSCPLWAVYEAFSTLGDLRTQVAEMPDGRRYFWVARTVRQRSHRYGTPDRLFSIGLGCELRHAHRLAYADGLDLVRPTTTPIGLGCKVCERTDCAQRAFPPTGGDLYVDPHRSGRIPYAPS